ncbi:MAG: hypothetical protein JNL74_11155, partial [Fibrobacteres bacterium]|nr:hypothetical protein [Fibrobacterota bacterium]
MKHIFLTVITFLSFSAFSAVTFTTPPVISGGSGNFQISFAVSEYCDVEVAIVKLSDSSVVRHLGAAVLGANPPQPFTPNSLSQTLAWDGNDDRGNVVTTPLTGLSVRVRAGMQISYEQAIGGNPYAFNAQFGINGLFLSQSG